MKKKKKRKKKKKMKKKSFRKRIQGLRTEEQWLKMG
jgi:hypothetical protein